MPLRFSSEETVEKTTWEKGRGVVETLGPSSVPCGSPGSRGGYLLPSLLYQVLETCVKNCGHRFHVLVANRDFIDSVLVKIISPKNNPPTIVQDKVLTLIQVGQLFLSSLLGWRKMGPLLSESSCSSIICKKEWKLLHVDSCCKLLLFYTHPTGLRP